METARSNKLGTMPVGKLLMQMSLPIAVSMLVQALYNVVDSIFVAQYSDAALAAVSLVFPIQNLMIAFSVGTSVGVASLLSRRLGEKNPAAASRAAVNGLFLEAATCVLFGLFGLFFSELVFANYANNPEVGPEIAGLAAQYMRIVTLWSFGLFLSVMMERLLQATGRSTLSMYTQLTGAVVNIILDPILIFGWFGLPEMGVAGAAIATVIGQWCGMGMGLVMNLVLNKDISLSFKGFRPNPKTIKHIYQVGLPTIVMQSIGSVMTFGFNLILAVYGAIPVSVFGIYFKLQSFIFLPVFGLNSGMVPIIAYNYGAKKPERIAKTVRIAVYAAFTIMTVGTLLFWLIPGTLLSMFNAGPEMLSVGTRALRVISLCFPLAAVSVVFSGFFQAVGEGVSSLILSAVRQMVVLLPAAWLLSRVSGLGAVWFSFPLAELVCLLLAVTLFRRVWKRRITIGLQSAEPSPE